jgi:GTP-binding protein YchF
METAPGRAERGTLAALTALRDVDAFVLVGRAFSDPAVPHFRETIDPASDASWLVSELLLEDLAVVERRVDRIEKSLKVGKKPEDPHEYEALKLVKEALENERPARSVPLNKQQERSLRGFRLLSASPWILVVNTDDETMKKGEQALVAPVLARLAEPRPPVIALSAKTEAELAALSDEDAKEFMQVLGIEEPGLTRMIHLSYGALGLLSFFTVGPDEVRAWTVRDGALAAEASGAIHSDLERGFIRAEVIAYDDLMKAGALNKARDQGLLRTEGKDYRVRDGDILNVRFSV